MDIKIVLAECWSCNGEMRIAFKGDNIGVHEFGESDINAARQHGVIIETRMSKTREEEYVANICPHCDEMFGQWYLANYWYHEPVESINVKV